MTSEPLIYLIVQFLGTGLVFLLAYRSFQKRRIELGEEPTLPQYFSRKSTYWLGTVSYCLFMAGFYLLLTLLWQPLEPFVILVVNNFQPGKLVNLLNGLDGKTRSQKVRRNYQ